MLNQLLASVNTLEFEEYGDITLNGYFTDADRLTLHLTLWSGIKDDPEKWQILCSRPHGYQFSDSLSSCQTLAVVSDHPLLWEYQQPTSELLIRRAPRDIPAACWALYERHQTVTQGWLPFALSPRLLASGNASLARGPARLLTEYETVLTEYGADAYLFTNPSARPFGSHVGGTSLALLLEGSYVIADHFEAMRAPEETLLEPSEGEAT